MKLKFDNLKDLLIFNIKYYRYVNNYSQEKLAELSKLSPRYITDVERGLHCPTIPKLEMIAKSLYVEPYKLFMNDERDKSIIKKIERGRQYNQQSEMISKKISFFISLYTLNQNHSQHIYLYMKILH